MSTRFQRDTAIDRVDENVHQAPLDPAWWVQRGPNGGYLAAIIMRSVIAAVDDAARAPRSLTIHFTAPPDAGAVTVRTTIERAGRSLTSVAARMMQGDRLIAVAISALSEPRPGPAFCDLEMPDVPAAGQIDARRPPPEAPAIAHRWDSRWAIGTLLAQSRQLAAILPMQANR